MNEKIKLLAEQSGFYFYDLHDIDGQDLGETIEADSWSCAEKFAELIIRECTKKCDVISSFTHNKNPEAYEASTSIKHNILEHFGIE